MAATATTTSTEKGRRIVGAERQTLAKDLVKRYQGGESIRSLAASTGRSYGFVHRVLTESGVQLRQRGGGFASLAVSPDDAALALIESYQEAFSWLRRPDIVSIAAVHGHAIGAGFQ